MSKKKPRKRIKIKMRRDENLSKYTWEKFKSRAALSQRMFHQIETYLNDFSDYVPLNFDHLEVYSLKLVTAILEIGPEIINSFDLAAFPSGSMTIFELYDDSIIGHRKKLFEKERDLRKKKRSLTFKDYYDFLKSPEVCNLDQATIRLRPLDAYIMPFQKINPDWWESYNQLRHDKYDNLKSATLQNALKAASALFWLVHHNSKRIFASTFSSNLFSKVENYEIDPARTSLTKI